MPPRGVPAPAKGNTPPFGGVSLEPWLAAKDSNLCELIQSSAQGCTWGRQRVESACSTRIMSEWVQCVHGFK
jgi:hypothetical protein